MKRIFTHLFLIACIGSLAAQRSNFFRKEMLHQPMKAQARVATTGLEDFSAEAGHPAVPPSQSGLRTADEIGFTFYDLQANASDNTHLVNLGNSDLRSVWNFNKKSGDANFADRGTAYTRTVAGIFPTAPAQQPQERIEGTRTGFGALNVMDDGTEIVVSHRATTAGHYLLHWAKRPLNSTAWTEGDIPTAASNGELWPRSAASEGKLHVIGITSTTATNVGGVLVDGINGQIRYFRSSDNGATWDIQDALLPGLDASVLRQHNAEQYVIDADGDNVVIGVFPTCSDICYWKSTDAGKTFVKHTIYRFPIVNFVPGDGYTTAQIDTAFNTFKVNTASGIDSLAVWSSDEHGSVRIDALGKVRIAYGGGFINASESNTTGAYTYYPSTGGVIYWDESMGEDDSELDGQPVGLLVGEPIDYDGNGGIDIDSGNNEYNSYGGCFMASQPTMGLGTGPDDLYIAFTAADERFFDDKGEAYAHVHIIGTHDGGQSWEGPYDVNNTDNMDEVEIMITETALPFLARNCGDRIHLVYEQDNIAGSFVTDNANAAPTADDISYITDLGLDPAALSVGTHDIARPEEVSVVISPNPAAEWLNVELTILKRTGPVSVSIMDMNGRQAFQKDGIDAAAGLLSVPLAGMPSGVYSLVVRTDLGLAAKKFAVVR